MDRNYIDVFTDGSLVRMGILIHCGYGIYFPNGEYKDISRRYDHEPITNNRAELYAILKSIILCNKVSEERKKNFETVIEKINIYSDSEYSVNIFNKWLVNWKKINKQYLNKDLVDEIDEHIKNAQFEINLIHIHAHTGKKDYFSISNDKADTLAKKGAFRK